MKHKKPIEEIRQKIKTMRFVYAEHTAVRDSFNTILDEFDFIEKCLDGLEGEWTDSKQLTNGVKDEKID